MSRERSSPARISASQPAGRWPQPGEQDRPVRSGRRRPDGRVGL